MAPELERRHLSSPLPKGVQIVDSHEFKGVRGQTLPNTFQKNYNVLAVLGCQSGGKSTILNKMFGTNFQTMDAKKEITQTTQGIWMQVVNFKVASDNAKPLVVFDVEGTDSKERGEERNTFAIRYAMFSLAVADVVIINMWHNDLGRRTGSTISLFENVFAANFELFQVKKRITILAIFVRDCPPQFNKTSFVNLERNLKEIWYKIPKNKNPTLKFEDYFQVVFLDFPHRTFQKAEFESKCNEIKETFPFPFRYSRDIPAKMFDQYCHDVWSKISSEERLNIPGEKTLLANFRCEGLKMSALEAADTHTQDIFARFKSGQLSQNEIENELKSVFEKALGDYLSSASYYEEAICIQKKNELVDLISKKIGGELNPLLDLRKDEILREARTLLEFSVEETPDGIIRGIRDLFEDFTSYWEEDTTRKFLEAAKDCTTIKLTDGTVLTLKLDFSYPVNELKETFKPIVVKRRKEFHQQLEAWEARGVEKLKEKLLEMEERRRRELRESFQQIGNFHLRGKKEMKELQAQKEREAKEQEEKLKELEDQHQRESSERDAQHQRELGQLKAQKEREIEEKSNETQHVIDQLQLEKDREIEEKSNETQHVIDQLQLEKDALDTRVSLLEREQEEEDARRMCLICSDAERKTCMIPCGHVVACEPCSRQLRGSCPICRGNVSSVQQLFS